MANNVFERREKKYLVGTEQRRAIEQAARAHLAPDAFGRSLVTSVYLDTPDRSLIARSLEKPLYKEKLRLRAYGERVGDSLVMLCREGLQAVQAAYGADVLSMPVFFELKKKFDGIVYKRRVRLSLLAAWAFAQGASYEVARTTYPLNERSIDAAKEAIPSCTNEADAYRDRQIARELEAALGRYEDLRPATIVLCSRTAWTPIEGEDGPRITFDDELRFIDLFDTPNASDASAALEATAASKALDIRPIIPTDTAVMEVKAGEAMPSWLIDALSASRVYPRSFSKYGEAAKLMNEIRAGENGRREAGFHRSSVVPNGNRRRRSCEDIPLRASRSLRPMTRTLLKKGA